MFENCSSELFSFKKNLPVENLFLGKNLPALLLHLMVPLAPGHTAAAAAVQNHDDFARGRRQHHLLHLVAA